jgi:hypothetical protein
VSGEHQPTQREVAKSSRDHHCGSIYLCAMGMQQPMPKALPLTFKPGGACFRLRNSLFGIVNILGRHLCVKGICAQDLGFVWGPFQRGFGGF